MAKQSLIDTNVVEDVTLETAISQKTGKEYQMLKIVFVGGYEIAEPLFGDRKYIVNDIIDKNKA